MQDPAGRPWICICTYICSCICKYSKRNSVFVFRCVFVHVFVRLAIEIVFQALPPCWQCEISHWLRRLYSRRLPLEHPAHTVRAPLKPGQYVDAKYIVGSNSKLPLWIPSNALLLGFWFNSQLQSSRMILELCSWAIALITIQSHRQWELLL